MYILETVSAVAHALCYFLCFLTIAAHANFRKDLVLRNKGKILFLIFFAIMIDIIFVLSVPLYETLLNVFSLFLFSSVVLSKKIWMRIRSNNILYCIIAIVMFLFAILSFCEFINTIKNFITTYV